MNKLRDSRIYWIIYFFLLLFAPPIVKGVHTFFIVAAFSLFFLMLQSKNKINYVLRECGLRKWIISIIGFFWYTFVVFGINYVVFQEGVQTGHYISLINRFVALVITIIPCILYVIIENEKSGKGLFFVLENIFYSALIETAFCIGAFLSPSFKTSLIEIMNRNSKSNLYENSWYITVRSYGFADTLVDVFGLGVAVIAGVCFFYGVIYKKRFIVVSFLIAISTLFNSRTGVLLFIFALLLIFVFMLLRGRIKNLLYYFIGLSVLVIIFNSGFEKVSQNEATSGWIENGYKSIVNLVEKRDVQNESLGAMTSDDFYQLPNTLHSIFGTGHSRYGADGYKHTDSGYINDIWLAGFLGCIILYSQFFAIAYKTYRHSNNEFTKLTTIYIISCFLIFNIKASVVGGNIGAFALFSILFLQKYYVRKNI